MRALLVLVLTLLLAPSVSAKDQYQRLGVGPTLSSNYESFMARLGLTRSRLTPEVVFLRALQKSPELRQLMQTKMSAHGRSYAGRPIAVLRQIAAASGLELDSLRGFMAEDDFLKRRASGGWRKQPGSNHSFSDVIREGPGGKTLRVQIKTHRNVNRYLSSLLKDIKADEFLVPDDHVEWVRRQAKKAAEAAKGNGKLLLAQNFEKIEKRTSGLGRKFFFYEQTTQLAQAEANSTQRALKALPGFGTPQWEGKVERGFEKAWRASNTPTNFRELERAAGRAIRTHRAGALSCSRSFGCRELRTPAGQRRIPLVRARTEDYIKALRRRPKGRVWIPADDLVDLRKELQRRMVTAGQGSNSIAARLALADLQRVTALPMSTLDLKLKLIVASEATPTGMVRSYESIKGLTSRFKKGTLPYASVGRGFGFAGIRMGLALVGADAALLLWKYDVYNKGLTPAFAEEGLGLVGGGAGAYAFATLVGAVGTTTGPLGWLLGVVVGFAGY